MNELIREYGGGLFELAGEEKLEERFLDEIRALRPLLTRDYTRLLIDPNYPKEDRINMVGDALGDRVHPYLVSFVKLMTERGLATEIPACFDEYERLCLEAFGIVHVTAESAVPLTEEQKEKLEARLTASTGKRVSVTYRVDRNLIGGMKLTIGNRLIDDSVRSRLDTIAERLGETTL